MTTPQLSIQVHPCFATRRDMGRLYRMPGTEGYGAKIPFRKGQEGVLSYHLFPSITNVISVIGIDFQGWAKNEMAKHIRANFNGSNLEQVIKDGQAANEVYTQHACDRGTEVHKAVEDFIRTGEHDEFVHGGELYFQGWQKFKADFAPEYLKLEATVYGKTQFGDYYAGTIDGIVRIGNKVYALDWKTSKTIHAEVGIQLAAGINATLMTNEEQTATEPMMKVDGAMGIHLKADGTYGVHIVEDLDDCWKTFEVLRKAWNWKAFDGSLAKEPLREITSPAEL